MVFKLVKPPVVRRIEYIIDYLKGVKEGLDREELEALLAETKKRLETEKALAVGRGTPFRKDIKRTSVLTYDCKRFTEKINFVDTESGKLTGLGEKFLCSSGPEKKSILCVEFSKAYPHLGVIAKALLDNDTLTLPLRNKPPFRNEMLKYGVDTHQVAFDTVRDLATSIGLVNWYAEGKSEKRRQHVYLSSHRADDGETPELKVLHENDCISMRRNVVPREVYRESLWDNYIDLTNGIVGAPVFSSTLRDPVCADLRISDRHFNQQLVDMIDGDDEYLVIWSRGLLPRLGDSARMLKSLPPKNSDGSYIIFLKITRQR